MSSRIRFSTARQVFEAFPTLAEDVAAPPSDAPPLDFARQLLSSKTPEDSLSFCAYLLPRREAVWWACQCVRACLADAGGEAEPLAAAERWVREPEEEMRRAALAAGLAANAQRPAAWTALAAGWSGGSIGPDTIEPIPPARHLTAKAVRSAVLLALAGIGAADRGKALDAFITACLRFAEGGDAKPGWSRRG
jgi:hypothetical protein